MNLILESIFKDFLKEMKEQEDILGAWNFGSATHGLEDEYSDADVIFLVKGNAFEQMNRKLPELINNVCDETVLCWPEVFNNEAITNYGNLLKKNNTILQFDVFLINADKLDDFMCRLHYTDLRQENVLFDKTGDVRKLVEAAPKGDVWKADLEALCVTYWFHANMTIKYLKRRDFFKLNNVMRRLMDTHVELLLTGYDRITWGGTANKLHFIPDEKQKHVMKYGCVEDFELNKDNLRQSFDWFEEDYREVCRIRQAACRDEFVEGIRRVWNDSFRYNQKNGYEVLLLQQCVRYAGRIME